MIEEHPARFAEDEDMARARAFWNEHGKPIVFGAVLGLAGIFGFNYWNHYQQQQAEAASSLYLRITTQETIPAAQDIAGQLKDQYPGSVYAVLGSFALAKQQVEQGSLTDAVTTLRWVLEHTEDVGFLHVARIRLATLLLALDSPEEVLALLSNIEGQTFEARYQELMADAFALRNAAGDLDRARAGYRNSIEALPEPSEIKSLIKMKLDNLGAG